MGSKGRRTSQPLLARIVLGLMVGFLAGFLFFKLLFSPGVPVLLQQHVPPHINDRNQRTLDHLIRRNPLNDLNLAAKHRDSVNMMFFSMEDTKFWVWNRPQEVDYILKHPRERQVYDLFHRLFSESCKSNPSKPSPMFLDVGANMGFYSAMAASFGCRVIAFEPQPACVKELNATKFFNRFDERLRIEPHPVSSEFVQMKVSRETGCNTQFPVSESKKGDKAFEFKDFEIVTAVSLDQVMLGDADHSNDDVLMLKIDTEGHELNVLKSGLQFARTGRIANLVMEVSPQFWIGNGYSKEDVAHAIREFAELANFDVFDVLTTKTRLKSLDELEQFVLKADFGRIFKQVDIWFHRNKSGDLGDNDIDAKEPIGEQ